VEDIGPAGTLAPAANGDVEVDGAQDFVG
jgi:hypothetical protein